MPDTPLTRWRRQAGLTQAALAAQCGVRINTSARWERGDHLPRGDYLETLLRVTGLPTDAVVRPTRFLAAHPDFLRAGRPDARAQRPLRPGAQGDRSRICEGLGAMQPFYAVLSGRFHGQS